MVLHTHALKILILHYNKISTTHTPSTSYTSFFTCAPFAMRLTIGALLRPQNRAHRRCSPRGCVFLILIGVAQTASRVASASSSLGGSEWSNKRKSDYKKIAK